MIKGNLGEYLNKICESYKTLRERGLDLYTCGTMAKHFLFALPDKDRVKKDDGSIELQEGDLDIIERRVPNGLFKRIKLGAIRVEPYSFIEIRDLFGKETLERVANGEQVTIYLEGEHLAH